MKILIGIPARLASSRIEKKPLCRILGKPLIEHVYRRCMLSKYKDDVFIAVPEGDKELIDVVNEFSGRVITTDKNREHKIIRPGYRIIEACKKLDLQDNDMVIVVQGDEPFIDSDMIDSVIECKLNSKADIVHLIANCNEDDYNNPDEIKVVIDKDNNSIYMSRSPIPCKKYSKDDVQLYKQMCIFSFDYRVGLELLELDVCPLENAEYIEMARAMYNGYKIKTVLTNTKTKSVDTEEDRVIAEKMMKDDKIYKKYK